MDFFTQQAIAGPQARHRSVLPPQQSCIRADPKGAGRVRREGAAVIAGHDREVRVTEDQEPLAVEPGCAGRGGGPKIAVTSLAEGTDGVVRKAVFTGPDLPEVFDLGATGRGSTERAREQHHRRSTARGP